MLEYILLRQRNQHRTGDERMFHTKRIHGQFLSPSSIFATHQQFDPSNPPTNALSPTKLPQKKHSIMRDGNKFLRLGQKIKTLQKFPRIFASCMPIYIVKFLKNTYFDCKMIDCARKINHEMIRKFPLFLKFSLFGTRVSKSHVENWFGDFRFPRNECY